MLELASEGKEPWCPYFFAFLLFLFFSPFLISRRHVHFLIAKHLKNNLSRNGHAGPLWMKAWRRLVEEKKRSSSNFEELRREAFNEKAKKKTYKVY